MGRPLKFATPQEMQEKIDAYFNSLPADEPVTITGLALALDTTRELLCNYEDRDEFYDTVKKAKLRCEHYAEKQLYVGKSAAGPIFALKNYNWSDKQEHELSGKGGGAIKTESNVTLSPDEAYRRLIDG